MKRCSWQHLKAQPPQRTSLSPAAFRKVLTTSRPAFVLSQFQPAAYSCTQLARAVWWASYQACAECCAVQSTPRVRECLPLPASRGRTGNVRSANLPGPAAESTW